MTKNFLPVYLQIKNYLVEKILSSVNASKYKLLPEPLLAKEMGVACMTLRKALGQLKKEGIIKQSPGLGTIITDNEKILRQLALNYGIQNIGVFVPSEVIKLRERSFNDIFRGIYDELDYTNFHPLIVPFNNDRLNYANINRILNKNKLAGIIITAEEFHDKFIFYLKNKHIPLVLVNRLPPKSLCYSERKDLSPNFTYSCGLSPTYPQVLVLKKPLVRELPESFRENIVEESQNSSIPYVYNDFGNGMYRMVMKLIKSGHKRIAYLGLGFNFRIEQDKLNGYKTALEKNNIKYDLSLVKDAGHFGDKGYSLAQKFISLSNPPTVIICSDDYLAVKVMFAILKKGKKIPEDISVIGYNDISVSKITVPALTTLRVPLYEMGRKSAEILKNLLLFKKDGTKQVIFQPKIIVRDSCKFKN